MGTTQHDGINSLVQHRPQGGCKDLPGGIPIQFPPFNLPNQPRAGILENLHTVGKAFNHRSIQRALERGRGCQHTDLARLGRFSRRLDRRFHAHKCHFGKGFSQMVQCGRRSSVAGHHDQLGTLVKQKTRDGFRKTAHLSERTRSVWHMCLITEIDHRFLWHRGPGCRDFERRLGLYDGYRRELPADIDEVGPSTQLLGIISEPGVEETARSIAAHLDGYSVIRATSPLDGDSFWLEVFPRGVSKSAACRELAAEHGIEAANVLAIGNDYNDLDVLRWAGTAFVTANAPEDLRAEFPVVAANDHGGVAEAVSRWLAP